MKIVTIFLLVLLPILIFAPCSLATKSPREGITNYSGQYFKGPSSPGYSSYDREMSMLVAKRIKEHYNVALDHTSFSAFDLLEIEALLKFKKSDESVESLLKPFRK
jgi:hypothetical protein